MHNPQSFYPSSPKKDFERATFTETHTQVDQLQSNFDTLHDEITTEGLQRYQAMTTAEIQQLNARTLSKARSMPNAQFTQYKDQQTRVSGVGETPNDFRKTAHNINTEVQNVDFNSFSPVPNRIKPTELNQTINTYAGSREFMAQGNTPNQTPKMIQRSTSRNLSQQVFDFQAQEFRPNINQNQSTNQGGIPPSNQRVSFQTTDYVPQMSSGQQNLQRASFVTVGSRPSVINVPNRPSVYTQQSNVIPVDSRNIQKSNATVAQTRAQYQSIIVDQQGNVVNPLKDQTSRQQKFSFVSDTLPDPNAVQEYQEVEIQRPEYRKIHTNKDEYYRTAGPQEDYYKEEKTCCSRLLPVLGVLALLLLIGGTLVGIGVMTGLIGGKNYLSKFEGDAMQKSGAIVPAGGVDQENKFVSNEVENGNVEPVVNTTVVTPPTVANITQVEPIVKNQTIVAPPVVTPPVVEPPKIENATTVIQKPTVRPVQPISKPTEPVIVPVAPLTSQITVTPTTQPVTPTTQPVAYIESTETITVKPVVKPATIQPVITTPAQVIEKPIKPATIEPTLVPATITKNETVIPATVEPITVPTKIDSVKPATIEPITAPTKIDTVKPTSVETIEPATIQPTKVQPTVVVQPVIIPSNPAWQPSIQPTIIPITQPTITQPTSTPISTQQAQQVINTIIQQNSDIIPLNYKTSIKQDILSDLQTVPLNWRDKHQVELLAYQRIEKVTGKTTEHKLTEV